MSVKCGHCGSYGQDIAHVKKCSQPPAGRAHLMNLVSADPIEPGVPVVEIPTLAEQPEAGVFYKAEQDTYYKVVQSPSTGNWYAKEFEDVTGSWDYMGRAPLYFLTALDRVTAEQASRFGRVTSTCVFCARTLTDDRSIFVGYGEICAGKNNLPWGEVPMAEESDTEYQIRYQNTFGRADNE